MTVFVAHAPADREAAESLENYVERRGYFVELDDGQTALRPISPTDVLVLLSSEQLLAAPERTRLEQRSFDAWAADRLVIVRLDQAAPPVGLRDLPSFEREGDDWPSAAQAVQQALSRTARPPVAVRKPSAWPAIIGLLLGLLAGLAALWVIAAIWLVNRIGPTPGGWPELRTGLDAFALRAGVPLGALVLPSLAAIGLGSTAWFAAHLMRATGRRGRSHSFAVLYAGADKERLAPLLEAAARAKVRLVRPAAYDFRGLSDLVASTARCIVFCSPDAFADDSLKRALYAADRVGVKPLPVHLRSEPPPQDFAHFLAGAGGVKLYETPEPQMAQAFLTALGAAA